MHPPSKVARVVRKAVDRRSRDVALVVATAPVVAGSILLFPGVENGVVRLEQGVRLTAATLAVVFLVAFVAATIKGAMGFGAALLATPVVSTVVDPATAVVVLALAPWTINVVQVAETGIGLAYVSEEWPLLLFALLGTVVGLTALAAYGTSELVGLLIGAFVVGYSVLRWLSSEGTIDRAGHPVGLGSAGFAGGFLVAMANVGPVIPAYLHAVERDPERYVGGVSLVFAAVFTVRIVALVSIGLLTAHRIWLGSAIATVSLGGYWLGTTVRRTSVDRSTFDRAVTGLLFVVGLNLLRDAVPPVLG